jgi:putative NADH-flavin reductase
MIKIIIFGATGGTGKLVVQQALEAGNLVTIVVRNPTTFDFRHHNLEIIQGDIFQIATFENAIKGKDVVVSCLGIQKREPTTVYSEGVTNLLKAMGKHGVNRIICLSAGAVIVPPEGSFMTKFFIKNVLQKIFKYLYADMLIMEKILKATRFNYTIVRPPWLRNSKHTGKYRTSINQHLANPTKISRTDLADYIVQNLTNSATFQATIELSY